VTAGTVGASRGDGNGRHCGLQVLPRAASSEGNDPRQGFCEGGRWGASQREKKSDREL